MAGATPNYALPYPDLTDTADVPRDVKALADKLDLMKGLVVPPQVTSVAGSWPASPADGDLVTWAVNLASGVAYVMRYNGSTGLWDCMGGNPAYGTVGTVDAQSATAGWRQISPRLSLTMPLIGSYMVSAYSSISAPAGGAGTYNMGVANGSTPSAANGVGATLAASETVNLALQNALVNAGAKNDAVDMVINVGAFAVSMRARGISYVPRSVQAP